MSVPLSILIMTMNEERNIGVCLANIAPWAGDVVVVDSGSTDRTLAICAEHGVRTLHHPYVNHRTQAAWALASVPWKHDWLLLCDADNVVLPDLKASIERMLAGDRGRVHGYYTGHHRYFRNQRVRGVGERRLLLVRRSRVRVDESELVDFRFIVDGPIGTLTGAVIENNHNEVDIDFWIDKQQKFARRLAIEEILRSEGMLAWSGDMQPHFFGHYDERTIWLKNAWYRMPRYVRPVLFFMYRYVLRGGFLDGWNGFVFHAFHAFWFRLLVDLHIGQYRDQLRQGAITIEQLLAIAAGGTRPTADLLPDSADKMYGQGS